MQLLLKRDQTHGLFVLCNEQGEALPAQMRVELVSEAGKPQRLLVEFVCDGKFIKVIGDGDGRAPD